MGIERRRIRRKSGRRSQRPQEDPVASHNPQLGLHRSVKQPGSIITPGNVLQMQSLVGNQAVQRMMNKDVIQRLPSRNRVVDRVGEPSGIKPAARRFKTFLTALDALNTYIMQTSLAADRDGIMAQFMQLRTLYADIDTRANAYLRSSFKKKTRAALVRNLLPQIAAESAQLVPIMLQMLDNVNRYGGMQPKLYIVLASNQNVGQTVQLNTTARTGTAGGGMNQVGFYNEGVFKAPQMHLTSELLAGDDEGAAMAYGKTQGMTGMAAQNEYWIAGHDLGLRQDDSLANREVAMSYLDRLLGAGMIVRTERALERDGVNTREGVIMERGVGDKMAEQLEAHGKESVSTNAVMRDLSKLQLLDLLALQIDRHKGNYIVKTDGTGTITGLIGFDHDMSFGRSGEWVSGNTKEIPGLAKYVDRELAQRIVDLDPEMLAWVMQGLIEPDAIEYLLERLQKLQDHLRENMDKWLNPTDWEGIMDTEDFKADKSYFNRL